MAVLPGSASSRILRDIHPTLFAPHAKQRPQVGVICLLQIQRLKRLAQDLLHTLVLAIPQQLLHRVRELLVQVSRERGPGVIGQNADKHDGIVLHVRATVIVLGQELAYLLGGDLGGCGAGFGSFDDNGKVEDLLTLVVGSARFAEESLCWLSASVESSPQTAHTYHTPSSAALGRVFAMLSDRIHLSRIVGAIP
jgi:hypothetical protein